MRPTRRAFLMLAGCFAVIKDIRLFAQPVGESTTEPYASLVAADEWMTKARRSQPLGSESGMLYLGRFADRIYFITKEIGWRPNPGQEAHKSVTVPSGFVTDLASIPRIFWSILPTDGVYAYSAIIHDYLYWEQPVDRDEADLIFRYSMEDFKVDGATIATIYKAVRLGGAGAWKENAALKASGERRILKTFPTDPTVPWRVWKTRPGVFET